MTQGTQELWDLVKPSGTDDLWDLVKPAPRFFDHREPGTIYTSEIPPPHQYGTQVEDFQRAPDPADVLGAIGELPVAALNSVPDTAGALLRGTGIVMRKAGEATGAAPLMAQGAVAEQLGAKVPRIPDVPGQAGGLAANLGAGVGFMGQAVLAPELLGLQGAAALAPGAIMGGATQGVANWDAVKAATGDENKAFQALLEGAAVGAVGSSLPVGAALSRINGAAGGALAEALHSSLGQMAVGGVAGGAQTAVNDAILEHATGKDLDILADSARSGGLGALTMLISTAVGNAMAAKAEPAPKGEDLWSKVAPESEPAPLSAAEGAKPVLLSEAGAAPVQNAVDSANASGGLKTPRQSDLSEAGVAPTEETGAASASLPVEVAGDGAQTQSAPSRKPGASHEGAAPRDQGAAPTSSLDSPPEAAVESSATANASERSGKPAASDSDAVAIKNESVDADLERLGYEPKRGEKVSNPEASANAAKTLREDPHAGERLIDELLVKPRALADVNEAALMLHERNRRTLEVQAAEDAYNADPNEINKARAEKANADFARFAEASGVTGTHQAQSFQFRQVMMKADYSLAAMKRAATVANEAKPLSPKQSEEIAALHKRISKAEQDLAEFERKYQEAADRESLKREVRARRARGIAAVEEFLAPRAEAALKRLTSKARSGIGGEDLKDAAIVGAHLIAKGAAKFEAFSSKMVEAVGDWIKPHLEAVYSEARALHEGAPEEQKRTERSKAGLRRGTIKIRQRTASEEFGPQQRSPIQADPEWIRLKAESEQAKREFQLAKLRYEYAHRSKGKKALDTLSETRDVAGAVMTAFDLSAALRQGLFFTVAHPIEAAGNTVKMVRALGSAKYARELEVQLTNRPHYELGQRAGLALTSTEVGLSPQEEMLKGRWAQKVPGVKQSSRAFVAYLNLQRAQHFDAIVDSYPGEVTPQIARTIAEGVNTLTGRGHIRGQDRAIQAVGHFLWAPRLYLSRFQTLAGSPLYRGDAATRQAFAREYARFIIGMGAVYGLGALAGGDTEWDPRSSDFGKIRFGNTRVDPTAGLAQVTRLIGQTTTGERKVLETGKVAPANRGDTMAKFLRMKLSPTLGAGVTALYGEDAIGNKTTPAEAAFDLASGPLSFWDVAEAIEDKGVPEGLALGLLGLFGAGLQTFDPKKKELPLKRRLLQEVMK